MELFKDCKVRASSDEQKREILDYPGDKTLVGLKMAWASIMPFFFPTDLKYIHCVLQLQFGVFSY